MINGNHLILSKISVGLTNIISNKLKTDMLEDKCRNKTKLKDLDKRKDISALLNS
jgi:hypothetical protein